MTQEGPDLLVEFNMQQICMDVGTNEPLRVCGGWKISPLFPPVVIILLKCQRYCDVQ